MKKKACIIDHSFHQKTNSFDFIIEFLKEKYDLTLYLSDSFEETVHVDIDAVNQYDVAFFFQILNPIDQLKKTKCKIVWIPMYDGIEFNDEYWELLSSVPIKIIFFSKKLYDYAMQFGFDGIYVQYFKNNEEYTQVNDYTTKRIFFWYRGDITLNTIAQLIKNNNIKSMNIFNAPDSDNDDEERLDKHLFENCNITFHNGFINRDEYLKLVSKNNIYIAPRLKEGMGMSFLEAMAMGLCIITHNDSTMNEYIVHGENGYLFDANNPKPLDLTKFRLMSNNSITANYNGWNKWKADINRIYKFIEKSNFISHKLFYQNIKYLKTKIISKLKYQINQLKRNEL